MDSTDALALPDVPPSLLVVGGGYIGLEIGTFYAALGSEVTLVEMTAGLLPGADRDLVRILQRRLGKTFRHIHLNTRVVRMTDTGEATMTGGRIARAAKRYLGDADHFAVTYGDGLTDADLRAEFTCHCSHGRLGTVLGVNPPSRFGQIVYDGDLVTRFEEKPEFIDRWINGGYFVFEPEVLGYLEDDDTVLEREPMERLAADGQLFAYRHEGFWQPMDTLREKRLLETLWQSGTAPWKVWE